MSCPPLILRRILTWMFAISSFGNATATGAPAVVKDVNPQADYFSRSVEELTVLGKTAVFAARSDDEGTELWSSDGTPQGTALLKAISPGPGSSSPHNLIEMGGKIYFSASDGMEGEGLWRSDGTAAGTMLFARFQEAGSPSGVEPVAAAAGRLWFNTHFATTRSLRCTDGTPSGTVVLNPDAPSGRRFRDPQGFVVSGDTLYFAANDSELWRSDGSVEGTVRLAQAIVPTGTQPRIEEVEVVGSRIYFTVSNRERFHWLWRCEGDPGTAEMIPRDSVTSSWKKLDNLRAARGKLFFQGDEGRIDRLALWCGDGTLVGSENLGRVSLGANSSQLLAMGDLVYFTTIQALTGGELWRSDGTPAGTGLVKDIAKGSSSSDPARFCAAGRWLYFAATDPQKGRELWRTDGTTRGTRRVTESRNGTVGSSPSGLRAAGEGVYFQESGLHGDLWFSNGTARGTVRLTLPDALPRSGINAQSPPPMLAVGETIYFSGDDGRSGEELWVSKGSKTGMIQDLRPGITGSGPRNLTRLGKRVLFSAGGPPAGRRQVWVTDGRARGTIPINDFPASTGGPDPRGFVAGESLCFFSSGESPSSALWVTDGSRNGTRRLWRPDGQSFNVIDQAPALVGSWFYFVDYHFQLGSGIWKTDGAPWGARQLAIPAGPDPTFGLLTPGHDKLFFFVNRSSLWVTDGSEAGAHQVEVDPPFFSCDGALSFDDRVLFISTSVGLGNRLRISDGTAEGSRMLIDERLGSFPLAPARSARIGDVLVFVMDLFPYGPELWRTDGTPEGTFLIKDIRTGSEGSYPYQLLSAGGRIYFQADDGVHGRELWCTDGTEEGTFLTGETITGPASSDPANFTVAGDILYFGAWDPEAGYELHSLDLTTVAPPVKADRTRAAVSETWSRLPGDNGALLRRAFNLPADHPGSPALSDGDGRAGFPAFTRQDGRFQVEYLRRTDGSLSYVPKWSGSLDPGSFQPMSGSESVEPVDSDWERVRVSEIIPPGAQRMFGIVVVTENP